mmetsp:Transcript_31288/g.77513  ORF Transcript_31288/g.77513 Transcript_31288/m.77513 type:complete len:204 (-) Transcript_31288:853-1464(-)
MSERLVPARTTTPVLLVNPSISTSIWLRVFSRSSLAPPAKPPRARRRPTASISSMNTIEGACFLACANRSLTREGPTPTKTSMKSDPDMEKKGTPASPATALANKVLPVPGGPTRSAPFGILAPRCSYFLGLLRKSTNSMISCLASFKPATSANLTFDFMSLVPAGKALPILKNLSGPPAPMPDACCLRSQNRKRKKMTMGGM